MGDASGFAWVTRAVKPAAALTTIGSELFSKMFVDSQKQSVKPGIVKQCLIQKKRLLYVGA
jgi:hypothetical protein